MRAMKSFIEIHKCEQDSHFHIIAMGGAYVSGPFWSRLNAFSTIDSVGGIVLSGLESSLHERAWSDLKKIKEEIVQISMVAKEPCHEFQGNQRLCEHDIAESWLEFVENRTSLAVYPVLDAGRIRHRPLICDFIHREKGSAYTEHTSKFSQRRMRRLANEDAVLRTYDEVMQLRRKKS